MISVNIPKDLSRVKQKVVFNLTKRQIFCFGGGALVGVPLYFVLRPVLPGGAASLVMVAVMLPFFLLGVYEKNGEPLETVLAHFIEATFLRPKKRIYQTENYYMLLERQAQLSREVKAIVRNKKAKAHPRRKAADP